FLINFLAHAGLALASALAGYVNCIILLIFLLRKNVYHPLAGWVKFIMQLIFANTMIAIYLCWMAGDLSAWLAKPALIRCFFLFIHVFAAVIIYLVSLYLAGVRLAQFR